MRLAVWLACGRSCGSRVTSGDRARSKTRQQGGAGNHQHIRQVQEAAMVEVVVIRTPLHLWDERGRRNHSKISRGF